MKDLENAKALAVILEEEYESLRKLKIQPKKEGGDEANGDVTNIDVTMTDSAGVADEDPEPKERGSEAVERRIEKVVADLRDQGLVDPDDEKALGQKKVRLGYTCRFGPCSCSSTGCGGARLVPCVSPRCVPHMLLLRSCKRSC